MNTPTEQINRQIAAAHRAQQATRGTAPAQRAAWLRAIASGLSEHSEELVALAGQETHLGSDRLNGELRRTTFQLQLFADEVERGEHLAANVDHRDPHWGMGPRPDIRRYNVPLGVVGVFGASNFPFAFGVMGGDSASALAAGCAVVHKIHEGHPELGRRTGAIVEAALAAAGAPEGLFTTITGRPAGETLVDHPLVQAIGFTGSTAGGRALFDRAARRPHPIPFYGELGSVNPVFVTEAAWKARREEILDGFATSFTLGMGQFCTKPGLLFIPENTTDPSHPVGTLLAHALQDKPLFPLLTPNLRDGYDRALSGMRDVTDILVAMPGEDGVAPRPTVLTTTAEAVRRDPTVFEHEMFGPAAIVVTYAPGTDLTELAGLFGGQLTATVHGEPHEDVSALLATLGERAGRLIWNAWPTGVTVTYAQQHGGPYPATTAAGTTSVGTAAISRFMRPVAYDSFPQEQLPPPLRDDNPWNITRRIDGQWQSPDGDEW